MQDYPFSRLRERAAALAPGRGTLVLVPNPAHNAAGDFSLSDGIVTERRRQTLTFAGIAAYDPAFFDGCGPGKAPLLPLLQRAIGEGRLSGERYDGTWTDVGTPQRLRALNES